jgi:hypothetical protein
MTAIRNGWFGSPRLSVVALQWLGNAAALVLASAWLQIPDSHVWQFVLSMTFAVLLIAAFCWLQVTTFERVRMRSEYDPLWQRMLAFALVTLLWFFLAQWISSWTDSWAMYPAYWNSKLSPAMRVIFTPARIASSLNCLITLAELLLAGLVLPVLIAVSTPGPSRSAKREIVRPYRKLFYWIAVCVAWFAMMQITTALVAWLPGTGIEGEIVSVVGRLGVAYTIDILLWCVLLSLTVGWMENARADDPGSAPAIE